MIALIDYGMGNLRSVAKALESVGGNIELVEQGSQLQSADAVILPGVGHFGDGMEHLNARGFVPAIHAAIRDGKPFLGICLGMQMLLESSEEAPGVQGLGVFKGKVLRFPAGKEKVPHMGWNSISIKSTHHCLDNVPEGGFFYFVHSYYAQPDDPAITAATCDYIMPFTAIMARDNVFATQFHPEKSQNNGLNILRNFVSGVRKRQG